MPQLDTSTFFSQLFWLAITFMVLYVTMVKIALPAIREVLQTRQDRVTNDLEKAEIARKEAEAAKLSYSSALEKARSNAVSLLTGSAATLKKEAAVRYAELDVQLERQITEAEQKIAAKKNEAVKSIEPMATKLAQQMVEKLLHKSYATETIASAVQSAQQTIKH